MWEIVPQVEVKKTKDGGKTEREVDVLQINWLPYKKKNAKTKLVEQKFKKINFLKVVLKHKQAKDPCHFTLNTDKGSYVWHQPEKLEYPPIRDNNNRPLKDKRTGKNVPDLLADKVIVKGPTKSYKESTFWPMLRQKVGNDLAAQVAFLLDQCQAEREERKAA